MRDEANRLKQMMEHVCDVSLLPDDMPSHMQLWREGKMYAEVEMVGRVFGGDYLCRLARVGPSVAARVAKFVRTDTLFSVQILSGSQRWQIRNLPHAKGVGLRATGRPPLNRAIPNIDAELAAEEEREQEHLPSNYGIDDTGRAIIGKRALRKAKRAGRALPRSSALDDDDDEYGKFEIPERSPSR